MGFATKYETARLRNIFMHFGGRNGGRRDWAAAIADQTGSSPWIVARVINGKTLQVRRDTLERTRTALGMMHGYFNGVGDWREFLPIKPTTEPAGPNVWTNETKSAAEPFPSALIKAMGRFTELTTAQVTAAWGLGKGRCWTADHYEGALVAMVKPEAAGAFHQLGPLFNRS